MNRHERRAARKAQAAPNHYTMRCTACGVETSVAVQAPGEVTRLNIVHEDHCPFYLAIQSDTGEAWVRQHGYPMRTQGPGRTLSLLIDEKTGKLQRAEDVGPNRSSN